MATANHNLSNYNKEEFSLLNDLRVTIIQSAWNQKITDNLTRGALDTFLDLGYAKEQISVLKVPGSFELIHAAKQVVERNSELDAVIVIGNVIRGETAHFDYVCSGVTNGIASLNATQNIPIIFCVLTDENIEQSIARSGGKHGNKGVEAAISAIKMVEFNRTLG